jgi:hypothetical protein
VWLAIISLAGPIGGIFAFGVPSMIVDSELTDRDEQKNQIETFLMIEGSLIVTTAIATVLLFRDPRYEKPDDSLLKLDRSESSMSNVTVELEKPSISGLLRDIWFILRVPMVKYLVVAMGICYGMLITFGQICVDILKCFGYEEKDGAVFGGLCIISGLIGSIIYSAVIMRRVEQIQSMIAISLIR